VDAEECLKAAFATDVRPVIREWRRSKALPAEPLAAFRESGYMQRIDRERAEKNQSAGGSYA
jgi:L-rhamnose isomerase/sugar isomerase